MKKTRILKRLYGVTPTIVLRRNLFKGRHVTQQDYGISFEYHVTLGFGSIVGGLDHANPVIRLPIEYGISKALGLVKPEIRGNVNFEIKSQFMRKLREDTFFGNKNKDAHDHVDRVLNIVCLFNIIGVSQEAVLLRVFSFTLTGSTKRWVDRLTPGSVNTWDLLKKAFIQSNNNIDGLAAFVSNLDNLGRDMKKLKENVHAIQVGCQIYEGPQLDKECPLKEDVKHVEEVKYGEFRSPAPFNGSNGAKFHVGLSGYYTRIDNRPPYREKRLSLEDLMNKHQEESARRSAQMDEWIKKLQENAEINTRNQSASLKNLETQIEQCKVVNVDHETPNIPNSSSKLNNLRRIPDTQRDQNNEERETKVLQCQLPPKEQNPRNFTLPCTIGKFKFYGMADLGASVNFMPRNTFEYLRLANLRNTNILVEMVDMTKKAPLGIEIEKYDPPEVQVETFKVRKYSFKGGQKFDCVTKEVDDALPLKRRNRSRFKEMIRKEFDINAHDKT
ncbi:zinc knuckle CX2CX4HX4C containing protein [Tanacetum coccineum]